MSSKIFISVASYRDVELKHTLESAIKQSHNKKDLHFGIVHQGLDSELPDLSFVNKYSLESMHPKDAKGAGYARSIAMNLYSGEDYFFQIDSHTQFVKDWDIKLINQFNNASKLTNNKVIISGYPLQYYREGTKLYLQNKDSKEYPLAPMKQHIHKRKDGNWTAVRIPFDDPNRINPEISQTVLAGFMFASGDIVKDVPYDPEISFMGEELCFAMRAWTRGYDIYSSTESLLYHFYSRGGHKKIWKDNNVRKIAWSKLEEASKDKQKRVLCGIEKGIFGAGNIRSLKKYEEFVGLDFKHSYGVK